MSNLEQGPVTDLVNNAKKWYESKTIIGVITTAAGMLLRVVKPEWSFDIPGFIGDIFTGGENLAQPLDMAYGAVMEVVGIAVAFWGRVKAKLPIKK